MKCVGNDVMRKDHPVGVKPRWICIRRLDAGKQGRQIEMSGYIGLKRDVCTFCITASCSLCVTFPDTYLRLITFKNAAGLGREG